MHLLLFAVHTKTYSSENGLQNPQFGTHLVQLKYMYRETLGGTSRKTVVPVTSVILGTVSQDMIPDL